MTSLMWWTTKSIEDSWPSELQDVSQGAENLLSKYLFEKLLSQQNKVVTVTCERLSLSVEIKSSSFPGVPVTMST